jgi:hypothetical protein
VPPACPGGKAARTAARRAQSSFRLATALPFSVTLTTPGVGQSSSVATRVGRRAPLRARKLIENAVLVSMQNEAGVAAKPAIAFLMDAAWCLFTTTVTGPCDPMSETWA